MIQEYLENNDRLVFTDIHELIIRKMLASLNLFCLTTGVLIQLSSETASSSSASSSSSTSSSTNTKSTPLYKGPCPHIVSDPADFEKHSGEWYEVERSANNYDGQDICHKILWGKPVNNVSEVIHQSISNSSGVSLSITSHATQNDRGLVFTHHFPTVGDVDTEYYLLKFNSEEYAIVWSCDPRGNQHIERAWVFCRENTPPSNIEELKYEAFRRYNLEVPEMIRHDHSNCDDVFPSFKF